MKNNYIFIGLGIVSTLSTIYSTVKGTYRYKELTEFKDYDNKEKLKIATKCYIPTFLSASTTIASLLMLENYHEKQEKILYNAYLSASNALLIYRESMVQNEQPITLTLKHDLDEVSCEDSRYFYDEFSQNYFELTNEEMVLTTHYIDSCLHKNGYITLQDIYDFWNVGIHETYFNYLGWVSDPGLNFMDALINDDMECTIIYFTHKPVKL